MKRFLKQVVSIILLMTLMVGAIGSVHAESSALTDEQKNAIAMLNHLTVLTQETNAAKNSRMFMEQAYASLINNTYPNAVDSRTLSQMTGLLDTMEKYRMVNVKRDRLQFIYEQNQAKAIRAAVPNPLGLLSSVHSLTPARLIASVVYMAVDSYTSYTAYTAENDLQFLKEGWALDDEEAAALHESRKGAFSYMIKMVNDYGLPGELALTEGTVADLVEWKNNDNVVARIQFLESNQKIYQSYGGYWLILADAYYNNGEFKNCLEAVATYEEMGARLFRWDYEYAKVLPLAIASAEQVYSEEEYAEYAAKRADAIYENTQNKDWALRYFAAQTYVDVYGKTSDKAYLQKAYNIVLDNVNYLVKEQQSMNETYLAKVKETAVPKDARLNRTCEGKIDTYVLDFVNTDEEIRDSFQKFYTETILEQEINVDLIYKTQKELRDFGVYTDEDIETVTQINFNPENKKNSGVIQARVTNALLPVAQRYNDLDEQKRYEFRRQLRSLVKWYNYITQIVRMFDEQLHKEYVFCSYLLHLIPPDKVQKWDLDDKVKLEYYKLQETFSGTIALDKNKGGAYEPATQKSAVPRKEQKSPIDEVIERFNENFAGDITEGDRILVGILMEKMKTNKKLQVSATHDGEQIFEESTFPKIFGEVAQQSYKESEDTFRTLFTDPKKYRAVMQAMAVTMFRGFVSGAFQ